MPTRITQIENIQGSANEVKVGGDKCERSQCSDTESRTTVLKVEGTLHLKDAELLEKICRDVAAQTGSPITLDLASISFIDSDSGAVLCRMKREQGVSLEGLHLFIENVVQLAEEADRVGEYLPRSVTGLEGSRWSSAKRTLNPKSGQNKE